MPAHAVILIGLWLCWGAFWLVLATDVKATQRRESAASRALHVVPLVTAAAVMVTHRIPIGLLYARMLPDTALVHALGLVIVALGLGFAVWARIELGRNWSGPVELKQDQELVRSGAYAIVRHPIYSGLLAAMAGTVVVIGEWRGLLALACVALAILRKVNVEERWLGEMFPDAYAGYRRQVPALVPFLNASLNATLNASWRDRGDHHEQ